MNLFEVLRSCIKMAYATSSMALNHYPDRTAMSNTLYDILEVSPNASLKIIRSAYRTLCQQYHPDKNAGAQTVALMAEINRAYLVLSDPLKRKAYDVSLTQDPELANAYRRAEERSAYERPKRKRTE